MSCVYVMLPTLQKRYTSGKLPQLTQKTRKRKDKMETNEITQTKAMMSLLFVSNTVDKTSSKR